jgi:very-short-patch-repair endonuclease
MAPLSPQSQVWALVREQHGVISHEQLNDLKYSDEAIKHRRQAGRLHPLFRAVYAVGRPEITREGWWMAAALRCGDGAVLRFDSGAALLGLLVDDGPKNQLSVPLPRSVEDDDLIVHRHVKLATGPCKNIPVAAPWEILVDLATTLGRGPLEAAIIKADKLDLIDPEALRDAIAGNRRPGAGKLRKVLDRATFVYTESELERAFVPLAIKAGWGKPVSQTNLGHGRVDFHYDGWVVEADGLRYHRTAFTQSNDLRRNNAHMLGAHRTLRFSHAQIRYEKDYVVATLSAARRPPAAARP